MSTPAATEGPVTIGHITLTPKSLGRVEVSCAVCKEAMTAPPSFGGIPQEVLVENYVKTSHLHKKGDRRGRPRR